MYDEYPTASCTPCSPLADKEYRTMELVRLFYFLPDARTIVDTVKTIETELFS